MKKIFLISAFGLFLTLLRFFPFLLHQTLYFGDNYSLMVPGKIFSAFWLSKGVLPAWNPYIFAGINWIGDINQSIVYFSTIFFMVWQPATALNITIILHYVLTFVGMYFLTKKYTLHTWQAILAGVLWLFSTQVAGSTNNLSTIQSISWIPLLVYCASFVPTQKKSGLVFSFLVLLQFLAGYPQHVIYTIFSAVIFSWFSQDTQPVLKKWLVAWLFTGILTVGLTAVAWLPFSETLLQSTRITQSDQQAQVGSLAPAMTAKVFLSYVFDYPIRGMKWGPAWSGQPNLVFYITWFGLGTVLFSLSTYEKTSKLVKFCIFFCLASFLFSLGRFLPFYEVIQKLVPLFRVGRYPSMWLIFTNLFLIIWMVIELPRVYFSKRFSQVALPLLTLIFCFSLSLYGSTFFAPDWLWHSIVWITHGHLLHSPFHTQARDLVIISSIAENLAVVSLFTLGASISWHTRRTWLFILFIAADVFYSTQGIFFFADASIYPEWHGQTISQTTASPVLETLQNPQYRTLTRNSNQPYSDFGSYWEALVVRAPFSDSFIDENELATQTRLKHLKDGFTPDWNMVYQLPLINGYTALLPQDFAATWNRSPETNINFIDTVSPSEPLLRQWAVKYYLVDTGYPLYSEVLPIEEVARKDDWSIREVPQALPRFRFADDSPVTLGSFSEDPTHRFLRFVAPTTQTALVVADRFDPNWQAVVDGKIQPVENLAGMQKISIHPGENEVELKFVPHFFHLGLLVSLIFGGFHLFFFLRKSSSFEY